MNASRLLPFALSLACLTASAQQWIPFNSGLSSVRSITTSQTPEAIYAVSFPLGIFKTTNDGTSWTGCNTGLPSNGSTVQSVGRGGNFLFAGTESGVYRSDNWGVSWSNINGTLTASSNVYANKWFRFGTTTFAVYTGSIGQGGGIARTENNGNTWLIGHSGMGTNQTVYHMAWDGSTMYAATNTGLYRSTDHGQQWSSVVGSQFSMFSIQKINGRLICITQDGIRYSTTNGATWTNATGDPSVCPKGELIAYDNKVFAITGDNALGVERSTNDGNTYSLFTTGLTAFDAIAQEEFHASGNRLYLGALQDLYRLDGSTVGLDEATEENLPVPYPTPFTDGFTVDLSDRAVGSTVVLLDAAGREVARHGNLPAGPVRIERGALAAGRYTCLLLEAGSGVLRPLGAVVAQ